MRLSSSHRFYLAELIDLPLDGLADLYSSANSLIEGLEDSHQAMKRYSEEEMVFGKASQSPRSKVEERQPYLTRHDWIRYPGPARRTRKLGLQRAAFPVTREAYQTLETPGRANEHHNVR